MANKVILGKDIEGKDIEEYKKIVGTQTQNYSVGELIAILIKKGILAESDL